MKKKSFNRWVLKNIVSFALAFATIITLTTSLSCPVKAAALSAPGTGTFWTNEQLKAISGNSANAPYYVSDSTFQKANYAGRTWYVIGSEITSDETDTLVLLSDSSVAVADYDWIYCTYKKSDIYKELNSSSQSSCSYNVNTLFGADAKSYVKPVTVSDASDSYLYLPDNDCDYDTSFKVGTNNQFSIPIDAWKNNNDSHGVNSGFWLRSNYSDNNIFDVWINEGYVHWDSVGSCHISVVPAFNLDLSSGLFASAAPAASSDTTADVTANGTMTYRITDDTKIESTVRYCESCAEVVKAPADSQPVYLCVQYNDGTNDKIYTKAVSSSETVDLTSIGDLSDAKVWIETKSSDNKVVYAKLASKVPSNVVTFDTKGGSQVASVRVISGNTISENLIPADPAKSGYTFAGWYKDDACTKAWDFASDTVTEDITLYALWTENAPEIPIVTTRKTTRIAGDSIAIKIDGVDNSKLLLKGKNGSYDQSTGIFTAAKKGTYKLYYRNGRKKVCVCTIKVDAPKLSAKQKVKAGRTKKLKVTGTRISVDSWTSSDTNIVAVSSTGKIKGITAGTATVTAKIGNHEYKCNVTVK